MYFPPLTYGYHSEPLEHQLHLGRVLPADVPGVGGEEGRAARQLRRRRRQPRRQHRGVAPPHSDRQERRAQRQSQRRNAAQLRSFLTPA